MNEIQEKIKQLNDKGWSTSAVADEIGVHLTTVFRWKAGTRSPDNIKPVMMALDTLLQKKPPPKRRYPDGHYLQRRKQQREMFVEQAEAMEEDEAG